MGSIINPKTPFWIVFIFLHLLFFGIVQTLFWGNDRDWQVYAYITLSISGIYAISWIFGSSKVDIQIALYGVGAIILSYSAIQAGALIESKLWNESPDRYGWLTDRDFGVEYDANTHRYVEMMCTMRDVKRPGFSVTVVRDVAYLRCGDKLPHRYTVSVPDKVYREAYLAAELIDDSVPIIIPLP